MRDYAKDLAVCDAASEGPWNEYYGCNNNHVLGGEGRLIVGGLSLSTNNAAFIALSREALPWYIRRVMELEAELARVREGVDNA